MLTENHVNNTAASQAMVYLYLGVALDRSRRRRVFHAHALVCSKAIGTIAVGKRTWSWGVSDPFVELKDGDPHPIHNPEQFVWDERRDVRPRSNVSLEFSIEPIGGGEAQSYRVNHIDHGVIRPAPFSSTRSGPRILMLGDSHLYGVTDVSSNASVLLERSIRRRDASRALVINAACMYYSPYQYVLRARSLWDVFEPDVVVAVFFADNDFIELDDRNRPFLDDALIESSRDPTPPQESTSFRRLLFEQFAPHHTKVCSGRE